MVQISSGVEDVMENPSSGDDVSLILTLSEEATEAFIAKVESVGSVIEMQISDEYLAISINERQLPELCEISGIESIEIEGSGRILGQDFRYPRGSAQ